MVDHTSEDTSSAKLWGGRFQEATDSLVEAFTESVSFDQRLFCHDIRGSIAHARMLARAGVLTGEECQAIVDGLQGIEKQAQAGDLDWDPRLEDVHMNIEARLTERIGETGKKLHTGRSRNDQIATDIRLYLRDGIDALIAGIEQLQLALVELAEREADTVLPGFTHLQVAQPVTFGHHMLAWYEMLARDRARLADCRARLNVLPLGAAALAGTTFPIDRAYTAELLGFDAVASNSLDAVSDRDFAIEFTSACSILMMHLSRFSEELVLWASPRFGFIDLPDRFCTGSSIMPQKKNPDVPELVRGKTGRVYGHLNALLTLMKGQPLAYNRDNQEDKEPLFDTLDTASACVALYAAMMPAIAVNRETCREAARAGFATATDLADYLVRKGVAFRDAHAVVGAAVHHALGRGCDLAELTLDELQGFSSAIEEDVYAMLTLEGSLAARHHPGGTAPEQVRAAARRARADLGAGG
jgi:argininosuccinate lyase